METKTINALSKFEKHWSMQKKEHSNQEMQKLLKEFSQEQF